MLSTKEFTTNLNNVFRKLNGEDVYTRKQRRMQRKIQQKHVRNKAISRGFGAFSAWFTKNWAWIAMVIFGMAVASWALFVWVIAPLDMEIRTLKAQMARDQELIKLHAGRGASFTYRSDDKYAVEEALHRFQRALSAKETKK